MNIIKYFRDVQIELQKVTWPTRQESMNMTWIVLGASLAVGLYVGALDLGFTSLLGSFLK